MVRIQNTSSDKDFEPENNMITKLLLPEVNSHSKERNRERVCLVRETPFISNTKYTL